MEAALRALRAVDFDWTTHLDSIWADSPFDVPSIQGEMRAELAQEIEDLRASASRNSPLGVALVGPAGSGKTHLLSALRAAVMDRGMFFVLVDMTDVGDFWETVLLGYVRSLQRANSSGETQLEVALRRIMRDAPALDFEFDDLRRAEPEQTMDHIDSVCRALSPRNPAKMREHQDVLRAMAFLASDNPDFQDIGYEWLQGIGVGEDIGKQRRFRHAKKSPSSIVEGISWFLSMAEPTVLALDQLDAIVAEHNLLSSIEDGQEPSARQKTSLGIVQGIAKGLTALRDTTTRTMTVVSALEATWEILKTRVAVSMVDRFQPPRMLRRIVEADSVAQLLEKRLASAYEGIFQPPYPAYPFSPAFFAAHRGLSPRAILKHCEDHRRACLRADVVSEAGVDEKPSPSKIPPRESVEDMLRKLADAQDVEAWLEKDDDRSLDVLIETACAALKEENPVPANVDVQIDSDFAGAGSCEPLHARLRLIFRDEGDRERHYAFRFIQSTNARAFQTRLKAALTGSGIAQELPFRRLGVLRTIELPGGPKTAELVEDFRTRGGVELRPSERELRLLGAIATLLKGDDAERVKDHLRSKRIVSRLPSFTDAARWLFVQGLPADANAPSVAMPPASVAVTPPATFAVPSTAPSAPEPTPPVRLGAAPTPEPIERVPAATNQAVAPTRPTAPLADRLPVGRRLIAQNLGEEVALPLENLTKHVVILAGAGSGKTVLVRALIEEAALLGVPSIVIDGANDLVRLGDAWPTPPESFGEAEHAKSQAYLDRADVVVWTPGRESGNPLTLGLLPDFQAVSGNPDEFQAALDLARGSLEQFVAPGKGTKDQLTRGVLASTLRFFAKSGGGSLQSFVAFLGEVPDEAVEGFDKGAKLAHEAAGLLRAAMETNPLLRGRGAELDPAVLLDSPHPGKTRVSVVNLSGLPGQEAQQNFVNQLAVTLFSWIKKHPAQGRSLRGLLIVDEAKDFVPSGTKVASRDSLIRLAAQARKYGLGIVFATQAPKSIDHNVIANASTQFYGRANSPASIDVVQEQLKNRGGTGTDIAKLPRGTFYVFSEGLGAPVKVQTRLCFSHHPASPPGEEEILARAKASSERLAGRR
ncbi:MAG TPA: AAA family ATPase [Polyangiaceae bacterium]|nr:AAA family ATPase [Polyangiaceae bacterium]